MNFIPEGDLYRLIVSSKLPAAEKFERWVFDEVLPTIRKHGAYAPDMTALIKQIVMETVTEVVKQLIPVITQTAHQKPTLGPTFPETHVKWPFGEPYRPVKNSSTIGRLVPELRRSVEDMISSPYYTQDDVVEFLAGHGVQLSRMAISRYARQMAMTGIL